MQQEKGCFPKLSPSLEMLFRINFLILFHFLYFHSFQKTTSPDLFVFPKHENSCCIVLDLNNYWLNDLFLRICTLAFILRFTGGKQ